MNKIKQHYVNLIIGFGKAGKSLAAYMANHEQEVVLIERSEMMYGGSCINIACISTKSLITSAEEKIPYQQAYKIKIDLTNEKRKRKSRQSHVPKISSYVTDLEGRNAENRRNIRIFQRLTDLAVEMLPPRSKRVYIHSYCEGLSIKETADDEGVL